MHVVECVDSKHLLLSYLSCSQADCWGTTIDFTIGFLHSLRFLAFGSSIFHSRPIHSLMLSSHRFLCLPLHLPPSTVPCRIVLASPDDCVTCPYHISLRLFIEVRRSSYGPMAFPILAFTSSLIFCHAFVNYAVVVVTQLFNIPSMLTVSSVCFFSDNVEVDYLKTVSKDDLFKFYKVHMQSSHSVKSAAQQVNVPCVCV